MFIKVINTNKYLCIVEESYIVENDDKYYFRCDKLKKNADGSKSYFLCDRNGYCLYKFYKSIFELGKHKTVENEKQLLYVNEKDNILTTLIDDEIWTIVFIDGMFNIIKLNDKQYFEIEYENFEKEFIGEGAYGVVYKHTENEVCKIFRADEDIEKIYNVKNYFDAEAEKYLFLPKELMMDQNFKNCNYSKFGITYDYGNHVTDIDFFKLKNILHAIFYLNSKDLAHFDISRQNICIDINTNNYKLIDLDNVDPNFKNFTILGQGFHPGLCLFLIDDGNLIQKCNNSIGWKFFAVFERIKEKYEKIPLNDEFKNKLLNEYKLYEYKDDDKYINYRDMEMYKKFEKFDISKKELFLRYDLFSFSIMLLFNIKNIDVNILIPFFELTLIQKEKTPTYDEIFNEYDNFLSLI